MTKAQLRKLYTDKRNQLSDQEYALLNQQLLLQFTQVNLAGVKYMHLFLPMKLRREPDTFLMRNWLITHQPQITRVLPRANFTDHSMQHYADDDKLQLAVSSYGITEPVEGRLINPLAIDMVLVPLLAYDRQGYRVGYGKGFYDRFMAQCRPDTRFIGVSFFEPVEVIDDVNEYDSKLTGYILPGSSGIF